MQLENYYGICTSVCKQSTFWLHLIASAGVFVVVIVALIMYDCSGKKYTKFEGERERARDQITSRQNYMKLCLQRAKLLPKNVDYISVYCIIQQKLLV